MTPRPKVSSKFSVANLIRDHYTTLRNHESGRPLIIDYLVYLGLPLACVAVGWWAGARARNVPEVLTAVAILTGLIFNVFVLLFDLTTRAAEKAEFAQRRVVDELAEQLRANVSYAVLIGIVLTAFLGAVAMFSDTSRPLSTVPTLIVIFGGAQLLLTIFMILKRVRALFRTFWLVHPERLP